MTKLNDTTDTLSLLRSRRSIVAKAMNGDGPSESEVKQLLEIAARVPDHGKLAPWRFILFRGAARTEFGNILSRRQKVLNPDFGDELITFEAQRFERAGTIVAVVSNTIPNMKVPEWEQQLSAGAVCQNLLIAATAMGFAAQWLTEWYAFDDEIASAMGLAERERIAGFLYLSITDTEPMERPRPDVAALTTIWDA
jgi:nitroreductase